MFTWDEEKNRRNIIKHGVDFAAVLPLFTLPEALVTEDRRKDYGEPRFILICLTRGFIYTLPLHGATSSSA